MEVYCVELGSCVREGYCQLTALKPVALPST